MVNPDTVTGHTNILGNRQTNSNQGGWAIQIRSDMGISYIENHGGSFPITRGNSGDISTGSYQNVIFVKSGTTGNFYIDDGSAISKSIDNTLGSSITSSTQQRRRD